MYAPTGGLAITGGTVTARTPATVAPAAAATVSTLTAR